MPPNLTPNEARSKVVEEILNTERDYVKHLDDIIEVRRGYPFRECNTWKMFTNYSQVFLKKCQLNTKLFNKEKVEIIFSNIDSLYRFQMDFLNMLEARVIPAHMEDSKIGEVFLRCVSKFPPLRPLSPPSPSPSIPPSMQYV